MSNSAEETYTRLLSEHGSVTGARRRESIEAAYAEFPDHPGIVALEAERHIWRGDLDRTKNILAEVRPKHPDNAHLLAVEGLVVGYEGDVSGGQEILESALLKDPRSILTHSNLPAFLIQSGEQARAEYVIGQGRQMYPDNPGLISAHYYLFHMLQKPEKCSELLALVQHIENDIVLMMKARTAMWNSKWSESEQYCREAIAYNPESSMAWEHLGMLLTHKGEHKEAKSAASFALELNSRSVPSLRNLAKIATAKGDFAAASQYSQRAETAVPYLKPLSEIRKANQMYSVGKVDKAMKILIPLATAPSGVIQKTAVHSLLMVLPGMEKPKEALSLLQQLESSGFHPDLLIGVKAFLLAEDGEFETANQILAEGEAKYADSVDFRVLQIRTLGKQKQKDKVESLATSLLEGGMGLPHPYVLVTTVLYDSGLKDLADRYYNDLIRKFPSSSAVTMLEMMRELDKGNVEGGISKLREMGMRGDIPQRKMGCLAFLGVMGKFLLYKLGFKKRKRK
jgi:Flp pilus assembly protein TadD